MCDIKYPQAHNYKEVYDVSNPKTGFDFRDCRESFTSNLEIYLEGNYVIDDVFSLKFIINNDFASSPPEFTIQPIIKEFVKRRCFSDHLRKEKHELCDNILYFYIEEFLSLEQFIENYEKITMRSVVEQLIGGRNNFPLLKNYYADR